MFFWKEQMPNPAHCSFTHFLKSLRTNEQMERFAQVAQGKWATVSKSLRLPMTNERMWAICSGRSRQMSKWANCLVFLCKLLIFSFTHKKSAIRSKKIEKIVCFLHFVQFFEVLKKVKDPLIPSEQSELIAQVAQDEWATMSDSLRSLRSNELLWANHSGRSLFW